MGESRGNLETHPPTVSRVMYELNEALRADDTGKMRQLQSVLRKFSALRQLSERVESGLDDSREGQDQVTEDSLALVDELVALGEEMKSDLVKFSASVGLELNDTDR